MEGGMKMLRLFLMVLCSASFGARAYKTKVLNLLPSNTYFDAVLREPVYSPVGSGIVVWGALDDNLPTLLASIPFGAQAEMEFPSKPKAFYVLNLSSGGSDVGLNFTPEEVSRMGKEIVSGDSGLLRKLQSLSKGTAPNLVKLTEGQLPVDGGILYAVNKASSTWNLYNSPIADAVSDANINKYGQTLLDVVKLNLIDRGVGDQQAFTRNAVQRLAYLNALIEALNKHNMPVNWILPARNAVRAYANKKILHGSNLKVLMTDIEANVSKAYGMTNPGQKAFDYWKSVVSQTN